jgi:hypothetical protein
VRCHHDQTVLEAGGRLDDGGSSVHWMLDRLLVHLHWKTCACELLGMDVQGSTGGGVLALARVEQHHARLKRLSKMAGMRQGRVCQRGPV